jgi:hypothetical protein
VRTTGGYRKYAFAPYVLLLLVWAMAIGLLAGDILGMHDGHTRSGGSVVAQMQAGEDGVQADAQTPAPADVYGERKPSRRPDRERFTEERFTLRSTETSGLATMLKALIFLIFLMMFLTPFIPGLIELQNPTDDEALPVDLGYAKDPRYFGHSFRRMIHGAVESAGDVEAMINVKLSRQEKIEIGGAKTTAEGERTPHVLFLRGDLEGGANAVFEKEAYVQGNAFLQANTVLRALACDGNVVLGPYTRVFRWVDAEGNVMIEQGCHLGVSAASAKTIMLGPETSFRRLFGAPVRTHSPAGATAKPTFTPPPPPVQPTNPRRGKLRSIEDQVEFVNGDLTVYEGDVVPRDLVCRGNLVAKDGAVFHGTIRAHGSAVFGKNATVFGSVFAEEEISFDDDCQVLGNVFGQDTVFLGKGCRIGQRDKIKSVIAKKAVTFSSEVVIYGFVLTEGKGRVL